MSQRQPSPFDLLTGIAVLTGSAVKVPANLLSEITGPIARGPANLSEIAKAVQVLPDLFETLTTIRQDVGSLDREVTRMGASVDEIHVEIGALTSHVDGVATSLHPFGRLRRRKGGNGTEESSLEPDRED